MILVTGGTGKIGAEAVRLLASQQLRVRTLVRDSSRVPECAVEIVTGNFDDPDSLDAATQGVDTVILVSPAVPAQEMAVIDSAVRQGVTHIVKITSKASNDSPVDRRRGQARIEAHLASTNLAFTLLRSNAFMQNLFALAPSIKATSSFTMSAGDGQVGMIDALDVAAVAATIAAAPGNHAGRTYSLTGPRLITYSDVAAELSEALGHEITHVRVTPDEHFHAMIAAGVPEDVATSNAQAFGLIATGDAAWSTNEVLTLTGRPPRDLHEFLASNVNFFK